MKMPDENQKKESNTDDKDLTEQISESVAAAVESRFADLKSHFSTELKALVAARPDERKSRKKRSRKRNLAEMEKTDGKNASASTITLPQLNTTNNVCHTYVAIFSSFVQTLLG